MYNLRYHIASLVSVFIALALGLVLGGLIVDEGSPANNQAIVDSLKTDIETVRAQSAETQARNDLLAAFIDQNVTALITNQLEGYAVIVIRDDAPTADLAQATVAQAGATALPFTVDQAKFDELASDSATMKLLADLQKKAEGETEPATDAVAFDAREALAAAVVAEWVDPALTKRPFTDALIGDGVLTAYGVEWDKIKLIGIVDATAQTDPVASTLSFALLAQLAERDYPAIVVSSDVEADVAYPGDIDGSSVSALNTLGTSLGDYTLVALLRGAQAGWYGLMEGARAEYVLLPAELTVAGTVPVVEVEAPPTEAGEPGTETP